MQGCRAGVPGGGGWLGGQRRGDGEGKAVRLGGFEKAKALRQTGNITRHMTLDAPVLLPVG